MNEGEESKDTLKELLNHAKDILTDTRKNVRYLAQKYEMLETEFNYLEERLRQLETKVEGESDYETEIDDEIF